MTEQERINVEVQTKLALHDEKFDAFLREMQSFREEMRQQNQMRANEMRDKDNQRHAEIAEFRNEIKEISKATDAKIDEIRQSVQSIQDSGRNQTIVTFLGIAAMVVAVLLK